MNKGSMVQMEGMDKWKTCFGDRVDRPAGEGWGVLEKRKIKDHFLVWVEHLAGCWWGLPIWRRGNGKEGQQRVLFEIC